MMFYIRTADKLTRTAPWLDNMEGGIDYLRSVIIDDKLGLERPSGRRTGSPARRLRLRVDRDRQQPGGADPLQTLYQQRPARPNVQVVPERDQHRPATPYERIPVTLVEEKA
ncbi:nitrite reductase subunit NirD [Klebsiella pneumoniae subsp. pneumoniae]|uniref:Nitrite reductase subunit NirD n=1 Tax=Klebsiella pneumoniae subsp. pneumoniae TaxID=72407 RepID=A0A377Z0E0_KLEPN|nr:nitrite reductase subunit NirD [Klebsiella pneumoniae subsp. pneumoniae]